MVPETSCPVSLAERLSDGLLSHRVRSPYQAGETAIHVLLPDACGTVGVPGIPSPRVVYVLPVEPHDGAACGDGLAEVQRLDLHNRHNVICVKPTFSQMPWYADHPRDPGIRQESRLLEVVVPFIDRTYCGFDCDDASTAAPRRLLLGFSKSGWGALSLLLRHPDLFDKAAVFDAPLAWESPNRYGMSEVFARQETLDRYCIVELLARSAADALRDRPRVALYGYSDFRGHHQFVHYRLLALGIPHEFVDGPRREHEWGSGWGGGGRGVSGAGGMRLPHASEHRGSSNDARERNRVLHCTARTAPSASRPNSSGNCSAAAFRASRSSTSSGFSRPRSPASCSD